MSKAIFLFFNIGTPPSQSFMVCFGLHSNKGGGGIRINQFAL